MLLFFRCFKFYILFACVTASSSTTADTNTSATTQAPELVSEVSITVAGTGETNSYSEQTTLYNASDFILPNVSVSNGILSNSLSLTQSHSSFILLTESSFSSGNTEFNLYHLSISTLSNIDTLNYFQASADHSRLTQTLEFDIITSSAKILITESANLQNSYYDGVQTISSTSVFSDNAYPSISSVGESVQPSAHSSIYEEEKSIFYTTNTLQYESVHTYNLYTSSDFIQVIPSSFNKLYSGPESQIPEGSQSIYSSEESQFSPTPSFTVLSNTGQQLSMTSTLDVKTNSVYRSSDELLPSLKSSSYFAIQEASSSISFQESFASTTVISSDPTITVPLVTEIMSSEFETIKYLFDISITSSASSLTESYHESTPIVQITIEETTVSSYKTMESEQSVPSTTTTFNLDTAASNSFINGFTSFSIDSTTVRDEGSQLTLSMIPDSSLANDLFVSTFIAESIIETLLPTQPISYMQYDITTSVEISNNISWIIENTPVVPSEVMPSEMVSTLDESYIGSSYSLNTIKTPLEHTSFRVISDVHTISALSITSSTYDFSYQFTSFIESILTAKSTSYTDQSLLQTVRSRAFFTTNPVVTSFASDTGFNDLLSYSPSEILISLSDYISMSSVTYSSLFMSSEFYYPVISDSSDMLVSETMMSNNGVTFNSPLSPTISLSITELKTPSSNDILTSSSNYLIMPSSSKIFIPNSSELLDTILSDLLSRLIMPISSDLPIPSMSEILTSSLSELLMPDSSELIIPSSSELLMPSSRELLIYSSSELLMPSSRELLIYSSSELLIHSSSELLIYSSSELLPSSSVSTYSISMLTTPSFSGIITSGSDEMLTAVSYSELPMPSLSELPMFSSTELLMQSSFKLLTSSFSESAPPSSGQMPSLYLSKLSTPILSEIHVLTTSVSYMLTPGNSDLTLSNVISSTDVLPSQTLLFEPISTYGVIDVPLMSSMESFSPTSSELSFQSSIVSAKVESTSKFVIMSSVAYSGISFSPTSSMTILASYFSPISITTEYLPSSVEVTTMLLSSSSVLPFELFESATFEMTPLTSPISFISSSSSSSSSVINAYSIELTNLPSPVDTSIVTPIVLDLSSNDFKTQMIASSFLETNETGSYFGKLSDFNSFGSLLTSTSEQSVVIHSLVVINSTELEFMTQSIEVNSTKAELKTEPALMTESLLILTTEVQPLSILISATSVINSLVISSSGVVSPSSITSGSVSTVSSVDLFNDTSTSPTTTEGLNSSSSLTSFWVRTVLKIRKSVNVSTDEFLYEMEIKMTTAYSEAYNRKEDIDNGSYEPLLRKKRMATSGDVKLQINNITRDTGSNDVDIVYILQYNESYVPAEVAVKILNLFSDQELALRLGYVVATKAETYIPSPVTIEEDKQLWIIGAVLGPIALILLLWLMLCCFFRCCRKMPHEENKADNFTEPHLVMVKRADGSTNREELDIHIVHPKQDYVEEPVQKGSTPSILSNTKRGKYEINPDPDEEMGKTDNKPSPKHKSPAKKGLLPKHEISDGGDTVTYVSEGDLNSSLAPKPKLRKSKQRNRDTVRIRDSLSGSVTDMESLEDRNHLHEDEQNEELLQIERKRNKQRLRERRKTDGIIYDNNRNSDLESRRDQPIPEVFIHKPKKRPSKPNRNKPLSHMNEGFSDDENEQKPPETLHEARKRMHQLLDDAFSLLSSSTSSIGNKVDPVKHDRPTSKPPTRPRSKKPTKEEGEQEGKQGKHEKEKVVEEKLHTPVYVNPAFTSYEDIPDTGIETWSPYRAGDEVARISLPQTQAIKDKNPKQDKVNTTTFSESLQTSLRDNYYTREPAKPIVIKTKDLESDETLYVKQNGVKSSAMPNGGLSYPGIQNFDDIPVTHLNKYEKINNYMDDNIEMEVLPSNGHAEKFKHKPHQAWKGDDELDVIKKSLHPGEPPTPLIESIRDELNHLSKSKEHIKHMNISNGDIHV